MVKIRKILSKLQGLCKDYQNKRTFFGVGDSLHYTVAPYLGGNAAKHEAILGVLEREFADIIEEYSKQSETNLVTTISDDCPIWCMWWQGEDNMPELVKRCYLSIVDHAGDHPVHLLTKDNIAEYTDIPQYIYRKMEQGRITLTHFSDIVRMYLLQNRGGYWMDVTILVTKPIKGFDTDFFSIKQHKEYSRYVCGGNLWTAYMLASTPRHAVASFAYQAFLQYWQNHDCLIDYYLIDYVLTIAYRHFPQFGRALERNSYEYEHIYDLSSVFYNPIDSHMVQQLSQIPLSKLNWRNDVTANTIGAAVIDLSTQ